MKKILIFLAIIFSLVVPSAVPVAMAQSAADPLKDACASSPKAAHSSVCTSYRADAKGNRILGPSGIATRIIQTFIFVVAAIALIAIIIGGLRYVLSGGDPTGIQQAKDTILYALVGLVIAIFAQTIVSFVLSKL